MNEHAIDAGGVTLAAEEAGEGVPVVLLHGLTATRRYVVMGSRALERGGHRVVAYDARGHGASDAAPEPAAYAYDDLARDLLAVLDALGLRRAVLAGASMGAHTIARFARDHAARVGGAVLVTPAHDPGAEDDPARLATWDALADGLEEGGVDGFLAAYEPQAAGRFRDTVLTVVRQRLERHRDLGAVADALRVVPRSAPFGSWEDLAPLGEAAAVVVVGSRDEADPGHPLATAEAWAAAVPGAELRVEEEGASPLAWQGGRLSRVIAEVATRAAAAGAVDGGAP